MHIKCKKTEMVILKFKQKIFEGNLKIKLFGKRLYPVESVKYLDIKIDTNLSCRGTTRGGARVGTPALLKKCALNFSNLSIFL